MIKKRQNKIVAFQSQWRDSYRFTFYFKAASLHLKRHFAKVPGSGYHPSYLNIVGNLAHGVKNTN